MGNALEGEISPEEQERFEMEVEEEFNPIYAEDWPNARMKYRYSKRIDEAKALAEKSKDSGGRGPEVQSESSELAKIKERHNVSRDSLECNLKRKSSVNVRYIFPDEDAVNERIEAPQQQQAEPNNDERLRNAQRMEDIIAERDLIR